MRKHHQSLSEKDQRKYAAIEAVKLGHGGIIYIARVLAGQFHSRVRSPKVKAIALSDKIFNDR
jgi:hypothetical protein